MPMEEQVELLEGLRAGVFKEVDDRITALIDSMIKLEREAKRNARFEVEGVMKKKNQALIEAQDRHAKLTERAEKAEKKLKETLTRASTAEERLEKARIQRKAMNKTIDDLQAKVAKVLALMEKDREKAKAVV